MADSGDGGGYGGYNVPPNTNAMDPNSTPSDQGQAARDKSKEVMLTLEDGKSGDADKLMGKGEPSSSEKTFNWFKQKLGSGKKEKKTKEGDNVVR